MHQHCLRFVLFTLPPYIFFQSLSTKNAVYHTWLVFFSENLPHLFHHFQHLVVQLKKEDAPLTADKFEKFVKAEMPPEDSEENRQHAKANGYKTLHQLVYGKMVHTPCRTKTGAYIKVCVCRCVNAPLILNFSFLGFKMRK